jgi:gamma-glutamyltranspeptidase/glutathione hydrolase
LAPGKGIVASGHPETSKAAADILRAGGNAYDAVVAALCAACVAEPLLVSLGGGGFLLAAPAEGPPLVFDFFCQTPSHRRPEPELDFYPIWADFGADRQEFHIGMGSVAVPGVVAGIFSIHRQLGRLPLHEVLQPAMALARTGTSLNAMQHYTVRILEPILRAAPGVFRLFESPLAPGELIREGENFRNPDLAQAFQQLLEDGPGLLYEGDWGEQLADDSRSGGYLQQQDLRQYRTVLRQPLSFEFAGARCLTNPPPSPGGGLIALALKLLQRMLKPDSHWGSFEHVQSLLAVMRTASLARDRHGLGDSADEARMAELLGEKVLQQWFRGLGLHSLFSRGTTHISVADHEGNVASLTASNGEGSAYVLPGTGILLNNMLGEEDLNRGGFHQWRSNSRLASMMSPTVVLGADGSRLALGTGGSNRIRSAIMQVLANTLHFHMPLEEAINAPRLHLEGHKLSLEPGFEPTVVDRLAALASTGLLEIHPWPAPNLFFGGVHTVQAQSNGRFAGAADLRRGGAVIVA